MEQRLDEYTYNRKFEGNVLIVGRTGCGKTTFIQKLAQNKIFGSDIVNVFWISKIFLCPERKETIRNCFVDQIVQFAHPNNIEDFNYLIDNFMSERSPSTSENDLGELTQINKLIITDDVSGLADKSDDFSNFLTVSRKYGFSCAYVFDTVYPGRQSWEMIMAQTHIFNFFPGLIHSGRILKTLALFASRQKHTYLPNQQVWLNKLYFQISDSKEKQYLITVDTRDVNNLGPGKFRTSADNNKEQTCYFNRNNSDSRCKSYVAKCVNQDKLVFTVSNQIFDQNFGYKNIEMSPENLVFHGTANEQSEFVDRENFRDRKRTRSENSTRDRRCNESNVSESTFSNFRGGRGKLSKDRNDSGGSESVRKKPRYLSN